jgi:hypothetical protein
VLALLVALAGQLRAADASGPADADDIAFDADDNPATLHEEIALEPPTASLYAVPPASTPFHGRRATADLFRPPQGAPAVLRAIVAA